MQSNRDYQTQITNLQSENKKLKERLEALNEVWHKYEPTESVDINAEHLQELYEYIIYANKENEKLKNENKILSQNVKDTYDSSQDIIYELQEEIKNYQEMAKLYAKESNEREKLKKIIEIIKYYFFIDIIQSESDYRLGFEPIIPTNEQPRFSSITNEEGELIEEILDRKAILI